MSRMKRLFYLSISLFVVMGCSGHIVAPFSKQAPVELSEYIDMPFKKFINRIYLDDARDKYIKLEAEFSYLHDSHNVGGYKLDQWVRISIVNENIRFDNVMVPKEEAEICFELSRGELIVIYAKTTVWKTSYAGIRKPDEIALIVTKIKRKKVEATKLPDIDDWEIVSERTVNGQLVKMYKKGTSFITILYVDNKPFKYFYPANATGGILITHCDKDFDGSFETILYNSSPF